MSLDTLDWSDEEKEQLLETIRAIKYMFRARRDDGTFVDGVGTVDRLLDELDIEEEDLQPERWWFRNNPYKRAGRGR
jgi:hypothetical protein